VESRGKLLGLYHFASGLVEAKAEAAFFVKQFTPYLGRAIPVLDYEAGATSKGREWVRSWLKEVKRLTGVTPWLYSYYAVSKSQQLPELCKEEGAGFWLAQYWDTNRIDGFNVPARGPAMDCLCWQYTSNGYIPGYPARLDCNVFYGSREDWLNYCKPGQTVVIPPVAAKPVLAMVRYGNRGETVRLLQNALIVNGYEIKADGIFGPKTRTALLSYQKAHGLVQDAIAGPKTYAALGL
jgi:hypothetical protein